MGVVCVLKAFFRKVGAYEINFRTDPEILKRGGPVAIFSKRDTYLAGEFVLEINKMR